MIGILISNEYDVKDFKNQINMLEIIKAGQIVEVGNTLYQSEESSNAFKTCDKCDLRKQCSNLNFRCDIFIYFKRVATKNLPKTRRCKRLQNDSL